MIKTKLVFALMVTFFFAAPSSAEQVRYLARGAESLAAFARLIDESERTLDLATYIFEPCDASVQVLLKKIVARARKGVKVRVLLDAFEQSDAQKQALAHDFERLKIPLRFFDYSIKDIDLRMHNKFIISDAHSYIAGGRNLSDAYFGLSAQYNYVDRDIFVEGAAATSAQKAFDELWRSENVVTLPPDESPGQTWAKFCGRNIGAEKSRLAMYLHQQTTSILAGAPLHACPHVEFVADHADFASARYGAGWEDGKKDGTFLTPSRLARKAATQSVLKFIRDARTSLNFENYAYMPIFDLESAFTDARRGLVTIDGITNMDIEPQGNDTYSAAQEYAVSAIAARDSAFNSHIELISSRGAISDRFPLTPTKATFYIHAKSMYRDQSDALVGSFNLDSRSANINLEAVTRVLDCPELIKDLAAHHAVLASQLQSDRRQRPPIAPPEISWLAKIFATLAITEF